MGAKKKLVARISKSEPLILKSKPLIFFPLKTRFKTTPKTRTKKALRLCSLLCWRWKQQNAHANNPRMIVS
jgi:hypothetical protein